MAVRRTTKSAEWVCIEGIKLQERDGEIYASGEAAAANAPVSDVIELIDADRFILKDRKSDVINIAGKRSSLSYLNHHLNAIDGVDDGVFVVSDNDGRLSAYVVAPGLSRAQVLTALRQQLDPAFLPRRIHFVESLPRNAVGKLTRLALSELQTEGAFPDQWSSIKYRFAPDHASGAGHFPGNPIIPGALLLNQMLQAIGRSETGKQEIRVVKFLKPVRPGDTVILRWRHTGREIAFECLDATGGDVALNGAIVSDRI